MITSIVVNDLYREIDKLDNTHKFELIEKVLSSLKKNTVEDTSHSIKELKGLGKTFWQNINVNDFNASMTWQDFSLSYYSSPDHVYEFRTWYTSEGGHLVLRYITHINVEADAQV